MSENNIDMSKMTVVEGSFAVAHAVKTCRPNVISAYPITPQTHIVEDLSQMVADGEIDCQSINVESEFSAISALVGSSAAGARSYSATTSQGLLLMHEVLFNVSGLRLPVVMTVANRAVGAPINIWNDQQDSISQRDTGWIQMHAEDLQEASDQTIQAFKIAEDKDVRLPLMACMDGFILTHVTQPMVLAEQELVDEYLPTYDPKIILDPKNPISIGMLADPSIYTEFRYLQEKAMQTALGKIEKAAKDFEKVFGRNYGGLIDEYRMDDAEIVLTTMGSLIGTIKDVIDDLRAQGVKVGLLKIRSFRPFPVAAIKKSLGDTPVKILVALDKNISIGLNEGALLTEMKSCLYNSDLSSIPVIGFMLGHGGRDIPPSRIEQIVDKAKDTIKNGISIESQYADLREDVEL